MKGKKKKGKWVSTSDMNTFFPYCSCIL